MHYKMRRAAVGVKKERKAKQGGGELKSSTCLLSVCMHMCGDTQG